MITEAQRLARHKAIGSSDAPMLMGLGYGPNQLRRLVESKIFPNQTDDISHKPSVKAGVWLERAVLDFAADSIALPFVRDVHRTGENPIFAANLDGLCEQGGFVVEAKTTGIVGQEAPFAWDWPDAREDWGRVGRVTVERIDAGETQCPLHYVVQVQHQMYCVGRFCTTGYLAVLRGWGKGFGLYEIERHDGLIQEIVARGQAVWDNYVAAGILPPRDDE